MITDSAKKYQEQYSILHAIGLAASLSYEQLRNFSTGDTKVSELELIVTSAEPDASKEVIFDASQYVSDSPQDYEHLFGYRQPSARSPSEQEESASLVSSDTTSETMTNEEANDTIQVFQYAAILGTFNDISYIKRRRFALWADTNPAELILFHRLHALSDDVNYSRAF